MRAAGAVETIRTDLLRPSGWHLLGTARMGDDPIRRLSTGGGDRTM